MIESDSEPRSLAPTTDAAPLTCQREPRGPRDCPRVDVIVVAHNGAADLRRLIPQLHGQVGIDPHVVIIDNASTDTSVDDGERLGAEVVQHPTNIGYGSAFNLGLDMTTSHWVVVANQDISVPPNTISDLLARVVAWEATYARSVIISPTLRRPDGELSESSHRLPTFARLVLSLLIGDQRSGMRNAGSVAIEQEVGWISGVFLLARRATWLRLGGFDPKYFMYVEDTDLLYRHRQLGGTCITSPVASVVHYGGSSGRSPAMHAHALLNWSRFGRTHWSNTKGLIVFAAAITGSIGRSAYWSVRATVTPTDTNARELARMFRRGAELALRWYAHGVGPVE